MDTDPTSCSNLSFCFIAFISAPSLVLEASLSFLQHLPVLCHLYSRCFKTPIRPFHLEKLKSWIRAEPETYFWTSRIGAATSAHKDGDWLKSDSASKSQIWTSGNTSTTAAGHPNLKSHDRLRSRHHNQIHAAICSVIERHGSRLVFKLMLVV